MIDLTGIDTIDPALFTQLAQLRRHRHSQGLLRGRLVVDSRNVRNALSAVGFERLWPIFSTLEEAIASFGGPPIYA
ncbi:MAG TPA: hypothetical protein VJP85_01800 [Candidatus Baltobacteraceae bacterium]|nr:hypothetical protein [Candidatus Baltobacteraceae bacterium]